MRKNDLIDRVAEKTGLSKTDAGSAIDALTDAIAEAMGKGVEVALTGFGSFKVSARAARTGRNPQTGEPIKIAASKSVRFKVHKKLKDAVNT